MFIITIIKNFIMKFMLKSDNKSQELPLVSTPNEMTKSVIEPEQSKKEENKPSLQVKEIPLGWVQKELEQPPAPKPVVVEPVQVQVVVPAPKPKRQSKKKETSKVSNPSLKRKSQKIHNNK